MLSLKSFSVSIAASLFVFLIATFVSCTPDTPLSKQFCDANKVKLTIGHTNPPQVRYETNNVERIKAWLTFIDEENVATAECSYDGRLVLYFTETDTTVMHFSTAEGCRQISYNIDGKTITRPLTTIGIAYIDSLRRIQ